MAVSYLAQHFGPGFWELDIPFVQRLDRSRTSTLLRMMAQGVNSPLTSSCGRLFDGVAALIGIQQRVTYEAQAAIELEMAIGDSADGGFYPFGIVAEGKGWVIDTKPLFEAIVEDIRLDTPVGRISQKFHHGLVEVLACLALRLREQTQLNRVCLSGGTFQNVYLLSHLEERLKGDGFEVFTHAEVPSGDGGLSLGQALVAAHRAAKLPQ